VSALPRLPTPRIAARLADRTRRSYLLVFDVVAIVLAALIAMALRFDQVAGPPALPGFPVVLGLLVAVRALTNVRFGLYTRRWRYATVSDLVRITAAVLMGSLFSALVFYGAALAFDGAWADGFPRSFWIIEALLAVAILGGVRFAIRAVSDLPAAATGTATADGRATLLYGADRPA